MAALREIIARFGISFDDSELKKGDKAVSGLADKLAKFGAMLGGAAIVKGVVDLTTEMANQAVALGDQAAALGMSSDALQQWQGAAEIAGVKTENLNTSLSMMAKKVGEGTGPAVDALQKLGVHVKDASGHVRPMGDLFLDAGAAIGGMQNAAERAAAGSAVFGKQFTTILPLITQGKDGMAKLRDEVGGLGGGFSPDFIEKSAELNSQLARLNIAWTSFKARVAGLVMPTVQRFVVMGTKATSAVSNWADKMGILGKSSNLAAAAAVVVGTAFMIAGLKAMAPWLPLLATVGAIILVVDELITLWQGGDTLIGRAIDGIFGKGASQKAVAFVKDVVKFTQEFFSNTTRGWAEFKGGLELMWFDLTTWLGKQWSEFASGVQLIFFDIGNVGTNIAATIEDAFGRMWNAIISGAQGALDKVGAVVAKVPGLSKVAAKIAEASGDLDARRASTDNVANADAAAYQKRMGIIAGGEQDQAEIARQRAQIIDRVDATARGATNVTINNETTVQVPPGTPAQQMRAVGAAAENGARRASNRETKNALAFTAG